MKAKELMIGDWVWYNSNVFNEDEYELPKECYPTKIESGEDIDLAIEGCYEPIPITPEILEQNGFEKVEDIGFSLYCKDKNGFGMYHIYYHHHYYLDIDGYVREIGTFEGVNIQYIHQLQQAMRLCGITKEIKI